MKAQRFLDQWVERNVSGKSDEATTDTAADLAAGCRAAANEAAIDEAELTLAACGNLVSYMEDQLIRSAAAQSTRGGRGEA